MARNNYHLHLKGYVGGYDFDADYVDYILAKNPDTDIHVLIDSLGGSLSTALSIVAAFRNHGRVHVHFVGMNASAATIASLGATHISIDSSAMYLVHKCSVEFFRWASANSDKLADIIKEAKQMQTDLEKMDANVAQMYAAKCQKTPSELLSLMKKGGWLTAAEALEWGFVDEVTDFEEDAAPVITDSIAADMTASGIPVPSHVTKEQSANLITRLVEALTNIFKSNYNPKSDMNPNTQQQEQKDPQTPDTTAQQEQQEQQDQHSEVLAQKEEEIADLKAQIDALKKAPGASTSQVVENDNSGKEADPDPSSPEAFFTTRTRAQALYNMLP